MVAPFLERPTWVEGHWVGMEREGLRRGSGRCWLAFPFESEIYLTAAQGRSKVWSSLPENGNAATEVQPALPLPLPPLLPHLLAHFAVFFLARFLLTFGGCFICCLSGWPPHFLLGHGAGRGLLVILKKCDFYCDNLCIRKLWLITSQGLEGRQRGRCRAQSDQRFFFFRG